MSIKSYDPLDRVQSGIRACLHPFLCERRLLRKSKQRFKIIKKNFEKI